MFKQFLGWGSMASRLHSGSRVVYGNQKQRSDNTIRKRLTSCKYIVYNQIHIAIQIFNLVLIINYEMYRYILYRFRMGPNVDPRWNGLAHWTRKWIGCLVKNDCMLLYTITKNTLELQKYQHNSSCFFFFEKFVKRICFIQFPCNVYLI